MKKITIRASILCLCVFLLSITQPLSAQGYGGSLTFEGLNNFTRHSAGSRAMGGISIGTKQDIGVMFGNPAALHSLNSIQVSVAGLYYSNETRQAQNYAPVRYYPNLSLLLEGRTARIPNPDTTLIGFTAQDTVQRPFDNIRPDWSRSGDKSLPLEAMLAVPASVGDLRLIAGIGAVEYANMNHYYQNNNVLSPGILAQRPLPTFRPTDDSPVDVDWTRYIRSRKGTIRGYGLALAGSMEKYHLSVGVSGMILKGETDDYEQILGRGSLTFFSNAFRLDSVSRKISRTGTSDYSGQEFTISSILSGRYASFGFSVKLPTTITRSYTMQVTTDTSGTTSRSTVNGEDKMKLPWRGFIGLSLMPRENLTVGLEYAFQPYNKARYVQPDGTETSPWLSASLFRIGIEFRVVPWLALRGGMRGKAEIFQPEGNKIEGDPVSYTVYSTGLGVSYGGLQMNLAYEYSLMKYQDVWASAISKNSDRRDRIIAGISYRFHAPW